MGVRGLTSYLALIYFFYKIKRGLKKVVKPCQSWLMN